MGYFDESETFKQSGPGGIKKEPIVAWQLQEKSEAGTKFWQMASC